MRRSRGRYRTLLGNYLHPVISTGPGDIHREVAKPRMASAPAERPRGSDGPWNGQIAPESPATCGLAHGVDMDAHEARPAAPFALTSGTWSGQSAPRTQLRRDLAHTTATRNGKKPSRASSGSSRSSRPVARPSDGTGPASRCRIARMWRRASRACRSRSRRRRRCRRRCHSCSTRPRRTSGAGRDTRSSASERTRSPSPRRTPAPTRKRLARRRPRDLATAPRPAVDAGGERKGKAGGAARLWLRRAEYCRA